jgi:hypothetical protein
MGYKKTDHDKRRKDIKTKGSIVKNHGYFRAQVRIFGRTAAGPTRRSRMMAIRDLKIAQTAGSEERMKCSFEEMKTEKIGVEAIGLRYAEENGSHAPSKRDHTEIEQSQAKARRGINIQWPFSQLILKGLKTEEIRGYKLEHRAIAGRNEELWLVETKGPSAKSNKNAIVGDLQIGPRPKVPQIVATIVFTSWHRYESEQDFNDARDRHCIATGACFGWNQKGIYGWKVGIVRPLTEPVPVFSTNQSGFGKRYYPVVFQKDYAQPENDDGSTETEVVGSDPDGSVDQRGCCNEAGGLLGAVVSRSSDSISRIKVSREERLAIRDIPTPCRSSAVTS